MKKRVVILTEIISPYRIPVFNEISSSLGNCLLVLFLSETIKERKWRVDKEAIKFNYKVLPSLSLRLRENDFPSFFNLTTFFALAGYSPDTIIIGGYQHPTFLLVMLYAKLRKKKLILWCESTKADKRRQNKLIEAYKRWFIRNCSGYIVPGRASFEYLLGLGASPEKIYIAPNSIDNDYFSSAGEAYRKEKDKSKKSLGYPEKLILYVGRLIDKKGVLDLLKAFQEISRERTGLGLLLVGEGEGEGRYKELCRRNNLKNVFFPGFVQQADLPAYYALGDIFVLPTHSDPWGLVLNEAMACGLPVITSSAAGAARDLVNEGINGYIYKAGETAELVSRLREILADEEKRRRFGGESLRIIKGYSPLKTAEGFFRAINGSEERD